jgi:methylenetetrahydrofolate reductase (NADPH)
MSALGNESWEPVPSATSGAPLPATSLRRSLERARFEILPLKWVEEQLPFLPAGADVTVTASPTKGIAATFALCETLAPLGLRVIPHLSARLVRDRSHLADLLATMKDLGIHRAFVVAGDAPEAAGSYVDAVSLLRDMDALGHHLTDVGITGYPESHAFIPDDDTIRAMTEKAPFATHIVSQICYDPVIIDGWIRAVRARGVTLPIYIGVPGAVDRIKLARISVKVGLGESVRFLRKQHGIVSKFATGYTPDHLIDQLGPTVASPGNAVVGWHLFTFNDVEKTERWRQDLLARIQGATT